MHDQQSKNSLLPTKQMLHIEEDWWIIQMSAVEDQLINLDVHKLGFFIIIY